MYSLASFSGFGVFQSFGQCRELPELTSFGSQTVHLRATVLVIFMMRLPCEAESAQKGSRHNPAQRIVFLQLAARPKGRLATRSCTVHAYSAAGLFIKGTIFSLSFGTTGDGHGRLPGSTV